MGIEGEAAKQYFSAMADVLPEEACILSGKHMIKMSVLIATLGGSENVIKLGVRKMANVDKVVLIAGKPVNEIFEESEIKSLTLPYIKLHPDLK